MVSQAERFINPPYLVWSLAGGGGGGGGVGLLGKSPENEVDLLNKSAFAATELHIQSLLLSHVRKFINTFEMKICVIHCRLVCTGVVFSILT